MVQIGSRSVPWYAHSFPSDTIDNSGLKVHILLTLFSRAKHFSFTKGILSTQNLVRQGKIPHINNSNIFNLAGHDSEQRQS